MSPNSKAGTFPDDTRLTWDRRLPVLVDSGLSWLLDAFFPVWYNLCIVKSQRRNTNLNAMKSLGIGSEYVCKGKGIVKILLFWERSFTTNASFCKNDSACK